MFTVYSLVNGADIVRYRTSESAIILIFIIINYCSTTHVDVDSGKQLTELEDGRWAADQLAVLKQRANNQSRHDNVSQVDGGRHI